ncbi:hypothetical protein DNTS_018872, partial [Danionella cerebrum]
WKEEKLEEEEEEEAHWTRIAERPPWSHHSPAHHFKKASTNRLFRRRKTSAHFSTQSMDRHRKRWLSPESSSLEKSTEVRPVFRDADAGVHWTLIFLLSLALRPQVVYAVGMFEIQIRQWQNPNGFLQSGRCCDLQGNGGQHCSTARQCETFFKACLKEYQARVAPTGTCTYGTGSTLVLGGNSHIIHHHKGNDGPNGKIVIPFKYAWPVSTTFNYLSSTCGFLAFS